MYLGNQGFSLAVVVTVVAFVPVNIYLIKKSIAVELSPDFAFSFCCFVVLGIVFFLLPWLRVITEDPDETIIAQARHSDSVHLSPLPSLLKTTERKLVKSIL